jgi:DNA-binding NarL/FixJ family response regulator
MFSNAVWRRLALSLRLSERESQIVPALLEDKKESAIATHLGISRHTVHTYTERLYRKMGVSSRVGLVRRVFVEYISLARRTRVPSTADTLRDDFRASRE